MIKGLLLSTKDLTKRQLWITFNIDIKDYVGQLKLELGK